MPLTFQQRPTACDFRWRRESDFREVTRAVPYDAIDAAPYLVPSTLVPNAAINARIIDMFSYDFSAGRRKAFRYYGFNPCLICLVTHPEVDSITEMSRSKAKLSARIDSGLVEVKSKVRRYT